MVCKIKLNIKKDISLIKNNKIDYNTSYDDFEKFLISLNISEMLYTYIKTNTLDIEYLSKENKNNSFGFYLKIEDDVYFALINDSFLKVKILLKEKIKKNKFNLNFSHKCNDHYDWYDVIFPITISSIEVSNTIKKYKGGEIYGEHCLCRKF